MSEAWSDGWNEVSYRDRCGRYAVYARVLNPMGPDYDARMGEARGAAELFRLLCDVRDKFRDTHEEMDRYVRISEVKGNGTETPLRKRPSAVLRKYGGQKELDLDGRIARCKECFHYVDQKGVKCPDIGREGCGRFITVEDFWETPEGAEMVRKAKAETEAAVAAAGRLWPIGPEDGE